MSGSKGHIDSKPAREIFLTSSSLSFSSLSSSRASLDDVVETNTKESKASRDLQKGKVPEAPSQSVESTSGVTQVTMEPVPSPPSRLEPVQMGLEYYDPQRIPTSVFAKTEDVNWSEISNDSLFSLRMSNFQGFRKSKVKREDALMTCELLYAPSLRAEPEDTEKMKETMSVESKSYQKRPSSSPVVPWSSTNTTPSGFEQLFQAPPTKAQSFSPPASNKKSKNKKAKATTTTKKKKKKKKKSKCCIWSWLCTRITKLKGESCCFKWRSCCCCCCSKGSKAIVL